MEKNKISINEFLKIANVSENTVIRNAKRIPGLEYNNGVFDILKGTRYPGDFHRYILNNSEKKRFVLLKAISEYKYIDYLMLGVYQEQFNSFLKELLETGLIKENNLYNHYGANAYDCTSKGDKVLAKKQKESIDEISCLIAKIAGEYTGEIISKIYTGSL